jgi:transposase-like protein
MTKSKRTAVRERPLLGSPERRANERSETERRSGETNNGRAPEVVDGETETLERPKRRTFTAEYKQAIVKEADAASEPGAIGALLRREGLYSSHLATWRSERDAGALAGLRPKPRGPKTRVSAEARELVQLRRENEALRHRLKQAELIIEFQKKVHDVLGIPLSAPPGNDATPC